MGGQSQNFQTVRSLHIAVSSIQKVSKLETNPRYFSIGHELLCRDIIIDIE